MLPDTKSVFRSWIPNEFERSPGEKIIRTTKRLYLVGPDPNGDGSMVTAPQVFDYARMAGKFFMPDDKICLIFDICDYSELRKRPEFGKSDELEGNLMYRDLPEAGEWANEF